MRKPQCGTPVCVHPQTLRGPSLGARFLRSPHWPGPQSQAWPHQGPLSTSPTISVTSPRSGGRGTRPSSGQGLCQVRSGLPAPGHRGLVCPFPAAPSDQDSPAQGNTADHHRCSREQMLSLSQEVSLREAFLVPATGHRGPASPISGLFQLILVFRQMAAMASAKRPSCSRQWTRARTAGRPGRGWGDLEHTGAKRPQPGNHDCPSPRLNEGLHWRDGAPATALKAYLQLSGHEGQGQRAQTGGHQHLAKLYLLLLNGSGQCLHHELQDEVPEACLLLYLQDAHGELPRTLSSFLPHKHRNLYL